MKRLNFIYGLIILAISGLFITSCTPDAVPPSLSFGTGSSYTSGDATVEEGANVTVKLNGTNGDADLYSLTIYEDGSQLQLERIVDGLNSNPTVFTSADAINYSAEITFKAQSGASTNEYLFVLADVDGYKDSVSFMLTTTAVTPFNLNVDNLVVYNFSGPNKGSIDLQTGTAVSSSSTSGDVQDLGIEATSTDWQKKIKPKNGCEMFVAPSSTIYSDVTNLQKLLKVMDSSTAVSESSVAVGNIFVLRTPSATSGVYDFFIMLTKEVNETSGDNLDNYVFALKGLVQ